MRHIFTYFFLLITFSSFSQYTTPDDGLTIDFDFLVENSDGVVIQEGDNYRVTDTVIVAESDVLEVQQAIDVLLDDSTLINVFGGFHITAEEVSLFDWSVEDEHYAGFRFEQGSDIFLANATFDHGGGLRALTEDFYMENCTVRNNEDIASGSALGLSRGTPEIISCLFENNARDAIGSGANVEVAPRIEGCSLIGNNYHNENRPQINLGPSGMDTTIIRNNLIQGDPENTEAGGIGFSSLLGIESHGIIEGNEIYDNRYGIYLAGGEITAEVVDNIIADNDIQGAPFLGGSGINLVGTSEGSIVVTGNTITGNLWGVTLQTEAFVNLGDTTEANYNPGGNIFEDNGNGGQLYALFNNTPNFIPAMNNCWMGEEEITEAEAEQVISHQVDDPELGVVDFTPLGCTSTNVRDFAEVNLNIYPVPTENKLTVTGDNTIQEISIIDLQGKVLKTVNGNSRINEVFVGDLHPGIYIVKITGKKNTSTARFVKE